MPTIYKGKTPSGREIYILEFTIDGVRTRRSLGPAENWTPARLKRERTKWEERVHNIRSGYPAESQLHDPLYLYDLYALFRDYRRNRVTPAAQDILRRSFQNLQEYLGEDRLVDALTRRDIQGWQNWMVEERSLSVTTANIYFRNIKAAFNWATKEEDVAVFKSPCTGTKQLPKPKKTPKIIPLQDLKRLIGMMNEHDALFFRMCYYTAARVGDLLHLKKKHVHINPKGESYVIYSEGKEETRIAYLPDHLVPDLVRQMKSRGDGRVFNWRHNTTPAHKFNEYKSLAGFENKSYTPHWIRHTAVSQMIEITGSTRKGKDFAGHASETSTREYDHVNFRDLRSGLEQFTKV